MQWYVVYACECLREQVVNMAMARVGYPQLVAAVSNAGGLGQ
jgi:NAD(P)H-dependent flavin oxidoreductase YrpB (nitropropane dioxygenase family)